MVEGKATYLTGETDAESLQAHTRFEQVETYQQTAAETAFVQQQVSADVAHTTAHDAAEDAYGAAEDAYAAAEDAYDAKVENSEQPHRRGMTTARRQDTDRRAGTYHGWVALVEMAHRFF